MVAVKIGAQELGAHATIDAHPILPQTAALGLKHELPRTKERDRGENTD